MMNDLLTLITDRSQTVIIDTEVGFDDHLDFLNVAFGMIDFKYCRITMTEAAS